MGSEIDRPEAFKQRDASSYDGVAESFARFSDRFTRPIAERMVALADLEPASRVLDVGTGTGIVALQAAARLGAGGSAVGVDLSEGMLEAASARAEAAGLAHLSFRVEDAEALSFPDTSFDSVLSLYALLHFPSPAAAIAQMFRVLRPGGTLVVGVGARPPLASLSGLLHLARRLPLLVQQRRGRWLAAPAFLDGLVEKHSASDARHGEHEPALPHAISAHALPGLLRAAGFVDVRSVSEAHLALLSSPEEFWELQVAFASFSRKWLERAAPERRDAVREEFFARCRAVQAKGGRLTYPYAALIASARRPSASRD